MPAVHCSLSTVIIPGNFLSLLNSECIMIFRGDYMVVLKIHFHLFVWVHVFENMHWTVLISVDRPYVRYAVSHCRKKL